jgi:hypothetical protein
VKLFLFVEIHDEPVVRLINDLRTIFNGGKKKNSAVHITIRGPYISIPDPIEIDGYWEIIKEEGVLISGVSNFNNNGKHIVYLKVQSKAIRGLWWKPDYPISKYGFNPHITLYEGSDKSIATTITSFIKKERLLFLCRNLSLRIYDPLQMDLFSDGGIFCYETKASPQIEAQMKRIQPRILERATELMTKF